MSTDAQELQDWMKDSEGQEDLRQCATSNENHIVRRFSVKECEKGYWILPQSSQTSPRSMENPCVEPWISSLQESHVSPTQWQVGELAQRISETFGRIGVASLARWDHTVYWWKTSQVSLSMAQKNLSILPVKPLRLDTSNTLQLPMDCKSWENSRTWVIAWSRSLFRLLRSELRIGETDGSSSALWPTPTTDTATRNKPYAQGGTPLSMAVQKWATPTVNDSKNIAAQSQHTKGQGGRNLNVQIGGRLNPTWVEWLMGFPLGWTELRHSKTPLFLKSLKELLKKFSKSFTK